MSDGHVESPVVVRAAASLALTELDEVRTLKAICDAADGLDLKLSWGDESGEGDAVFLARLGARLVGYCSLDGNGSVAELCGMVAPDARRAGIGMRLFEAAHTAFRHGGGEQLYLICENASTAGREFVATLGAHRSFSEYRMQYRGPELATATPADDGALVAEELTPGDEAALVAAARIIGSGFARSFEQTLRGMREDLGRANERHYLARANGVPVGAFKLFAEGMTTGIYGFAVDPAYQRQGWGRRMLAQARALALAQGAKRVTLEVDTTNERAIALYTSSDFETTTTYGYYLLPRSFVVGSI